MFSNIIYYKGVLIYNMNESEIILACEIEHLKYPDELHLFDLGESYEIRGSEATEVAPLLNLQPWLWEISTSLRYKEAVAVVSFPKSNPWYLQRLRHKGYYYIILEKDYGKIKKTS